MKYNNRVTITNNYNLPVISSVNYMIIAEWMTKNVPDDMRGR